LAIDCGIKDLNKVTAVAREQRMNDLSRQLLQASKGSNYNSSLTAVPEKGSWFVFPLPEVPASL